MFLHTPQCTTSNAPRHYLLHKISSTKSSPHSSTTKRSPLKPSQSSLIKLNHLPTKLLHTLTTNSHLPRLKISLLHYKLNVKPHNSTFSLPPRATSKIGKSTMYSKATHTKVSNTTCTHHNFTPTKNHQETSNTLSINLPPKKPPRSSKLLHTNKAQQGHCQKNPKNQVRRTHNATTHTPSPPTTLKPTHPSKNPPHTKHKIYQTKTQHTPPRNNRSDTTTQHPKNIDTHKANHTSQLTHPKTTTCHSPTTPLPHLQIPSPNTHSLIHLSHTSPTLHSRSYINTTPQHPHTEADNKSKENRISNFGQQQRAAPANKTRHGGKPKGILGESKDKGRLCEGEGEIRLDESEREGSLCESERKGSLCEGEGESRLDESKKEDSLCASLSHTHPDPTKLISENRHSPLLPSLSSQILIPPSPSPSPHTQQTTQSRISLPSPHRSSSMVS